MDPLSVLGIAASIVKFLQFGGSLVSKSRQIHKDGALLDHIECENATKRLLGLTGSVMKSLKEIELLGTLSPDSRALKHACSNCIELSNELLVRFDRLKVNKEIKPKKWKSFRHALKSVCSKNFVDGLAERVAKCWDELNTHLILSIKNKADALALGQEEVISRLNTHAKEAIQILIEGRDATEKSLQHTTESLAKSNDEHYTTMHSSLLYALGEAQTVEIRLLRSLRFPLMDDRHFEIPEAHKRTFRWIFESSEEANRKWSNFVEWLERGSGLYWINGKAGSGKGLADIWKLGLKKIAAFSFWGSGSLDQRSQAGLFRSLLYQALHKRPDIVRHVFPRQWSEASSDLSEEKALEWKWSLPVLKAAFKRWIDLAPATLKLCFFIDGLDEYEGDKEEIAEFFKSISSSSITNVKICVSSRPWVEFDEAFEGLPGLRLQDLTLRDITAYVEDELQGHHRMQLLAKAEPNHASELVSEIVTKAAGVFLWVTLVVRSLLNGLRNRDDIDDLRRRLQELPSDLASLYSHMLNLVEPIYQKQTSRTFQIYNAMERVDQVVATLQLHFAIQATSQCIASTTWGPMDSNELLNTCERLDVYLKTRCGGLLEVYDTHDGTLSKVNYLHRSVKEFLETDDIQQLFVKERGEDFNPYLSAMMSYIPIVRRDLLFSVHEEHVKVNSANLWACVRPAFRYARELEIAGEKSYITVLEELERTALQKWRLQYQIARKDWQEAEDLDVWRVFRDAMSHGLVSYLDAKVKANESLKLGWQDIPLLFHALDASKSQPTVHVEVVDFLLRHGADPNQVSNCHDPSGYPYTPWQYVLTTVYTTCSIEHLRLLKTWAQIFKLFIIHGANPHENCCDTTDFTKVTLSKDQRIGSSATVTEVISHVFEGPFPLEAAGLQSLLNEKISLGLTESSDNSPRATFTVSGHLKRKSMHGDSDIRPEKREEHY